MSEPPIVAHKNGMKGWNSALEFFQEDVGGGGGETAIEGNQKASIQAELPQKFQFVTGIGEQERGGVGREDFEWMRIKGHGPGFAPDCPRPGQGLAQHLLMSEVYAVEESNGQAYRPCVAA
jgi:hypothetical protein